MAELDNFLKEEDVGVRFFGLDSQAAIQRLSREELLKILGEVYTAPSLTRCTALDLRTLLLHCYLDDLRDAQALRCEPR